MGRLAEHLSLLATGTPEICAMVRTPRGHELAGRIKGLVMERLQFDVFVENPQGATTKIHHDEVNLVPLHEEPVSYPYPYAYGFVIGVLGGDGDCLDAFVLSNNPIASGTRMTCQAIGLLEQWQNDDEDHDVLAVPIDELDSADEIDIEEVQKIITAFMAEVFSHDPNRTLRVGEMLPASTAEALVRGEGLA